MTNNKITKIKTRFLWSSSDTQIIEVEVILDNDCRGFASGPLEDSINADFLNTLIFELENSLHGLDISKQNIIDNRIQKTTNTIAIKSMVSMACSHAAATLSHKPLWQYFKKQKNNPCLPLPDIKIASTPFFKSIGILPIGAKCINDALGWSREVSKISLPSKIYETSPQFALETLTNVIKQSGLIPGKDISLTLDIREEKPGSSNLYNLSDIDPVLNLDAYCGMLVDWAERFPIASIENPFTEINIEGMKRLIWALGKRIHIVDKAASLISNDQSDNLSIEEYKKAQHGNAIQYDIHKAGTVSEITTIISIAREASADIIFSSEDPFTADDNFIHLAVALGAHRIKFPPITPTSSMKHWNTLLRIEENNIPLAKLSTDN